MQGLTAAFRSLSSTVSGYLNIHPVINEACEDSSTATPGYLYKQIAGTHCVCGAHEALFAAVVSRLFFLLVSPPLSPVHGLLSVLSKRIFQLSYPFPPVLS